jgi:PST family polysaccharide transporter
VAAARLAAQIAGGATGVLLALRGGTVWALVAQQYVEYSALILIVWRLERWRPRLPWQGDPIASVVRVGGAITAMNLGQFVLVNCDKVLVGIFYGPVALGLYGQAFNLMMKPVTIVTNPLGSIMLAALSRAQSDGPTYRYVLAAFLRLAAVIGFPCGVGLWVVASDAMLVLGGPEWLPAGPILQVLSLVIIARSSMDVGTNVFMSSGAWGRMTLAVWGRASAAMLGAALAASLAGVWHSDAVAAATYVAWGYTLAIAAVVFLPYMAAALGAVGIKLRTWLLLVVRPALAALAMGGLVWFVGTLIDRTSEPHAVLRLAIEIAVGVVTYSLLAWRDVRWCLTQLRAW